MTAELARLDAATALATSGDPADVAAAVASLPWLTASIRADAAAGRFDAWGRSTAIDEHAGAVLSPALFEELHRLAGIAAAWPVGNAGVLHVYGYLLSAVPTPWGRKRERWLGGALARAYGRDAAGYLPWAGEGTLLERVTADATALLIGADRHGRGRPGTFRRVERVGGLDATTVVYSPRGAEGAEGAGSAGSAAHEASALAYGLDDGRGIRLVTTFPVDDPAVVLGGLEASGPRLRWNAAAPAMPAPPAPPAQEGRSAAR